MPPAYVKPSVKRQKNDVADAEAICEAVGRPTMRFVETKTPEQQGCLTLHRTWHLLIRQQTSVINAIRAHLAEFGVVAPVGHASTHLKEYRGLASSEPVVSHHGASRREAAVNSPSGRPHSRARSRSRVDVVDVQSVRRMLFSALEGVLRPDAHYDAVRFHGLCPCFVIRVFWKLPLGPRNSTTKIR